MIYKQHNPHTRRPWSTLWAALLLLSPSVNAAEDVAQEAPLIPISIIIDDLGTQHASGMRALELPGAVTYAFLPHTPHTHTLATHAHEHGKEIMVHMPMESMEGRRLGPDGLTLDMTQSTFTKTLFSAIQSVPYAVGLNNHMGSLLTRHPGHMEWLMSNLERSNIFYFIDSRTTHHTVALQLAKEHSIPSRRRDVFLDDDPSLEGIEVQLQRLIKVAKRKGSAIAIGHPYDTTLSLLEKAIPQLESEGLKLVPVSELIPAARQAMIKHEKSKRALVLNMSTESHKN